MPIEIDGQIYFRTSEAYRKAGISRATLFRWLKTGILEKSYEDRRGWRIFTEENLRKLQTEAKRTQVEYTTHGRQQ